MDSFILGLDFGSDSARALVVDAADGAVVGSAVHPYSRWGEGLYCSSAEGRYRQHPLDHIESLEAAAKAALAQAGGAARRALRGISVDTTASTPCLVDSSLRPLALSEPFREDPDSMFVLWKEHCAAAEAREITERAKSWGGEDYTAFSGGEYSSEWFWAKILRILRRRPELARAAATAVEHCDWMPALLTGCSRPSDLKRSRGAAGHKALWKASWGGYPPLSFWAGLDPRLAELARGLAPDTYVGGEPCGRLCPEWAGRLGLETSTVVGVGTVDAHTGALGAGIAPGVLVQILGTSACDILIGPEPRGREKPIPGICGQVDGSVLGGFIGYEAGQSAFGDVLAWFRDLLLWPLKNASNQGGCCLFPDSLLPLLETAASRAAPGSSGLLAVDWFNGRRSPDDNPSLKAALSGLGLGCDAPAIYRALLESLAMGSRAIVERYRGEGLRIEKAIATGGVARKSGLAMQIMADVLGMRIEVAASDQAVALGSAMFAGVAAGLYPDALAAEAALGSGSDLSYVPDPERTVFYEGLYRRYCRLGAFLEGEPE
jgi:L-ribulokinase